MVQPSVTSAGTQIPRWLKAVLAGALLGLLLAGGIRLISGRQAAFAGPSAKVAAVDPLDDAALRYAEAYQHGDWDYVFAHTLWIQDRLAHVAAHEAGEKAREEARLSLMASISDRSVAGNHLLEGGVADQYVFRPGAQVVVERGDAGRDDLHRPAAWRTWLRVTYPAAENALLDVLGLPVEALTVGVNLDASGHVLKAAVYGNVEIDWDSVVYQHADRALLR